MSGLAHEHNQRILRFLRKHAREDGERGPREGELDYIEAGSHPEVVERIWDQLGSDLPKSSRRVIYGYPALVQPNSRVITAVALGTAYALRVPASAIGTTRTWIQWSDGGRLDLKAEFGVGWAAGTYDARETDWCSQAFENSFSGKEDG